MERKLLIFGNGLGMSLDSEYFSLSTALKEIWKGSEHFQEEHKRLVISALPNINTGDEFPDSETQLDTLQVAIVASEFLRNFESNEIQWLNENSRKFPEAFKRFIHEVASYFHDSEYFLPDEFIKPLSTFVNETKSHIAVLNYDNLLYDGLVNNEVLRGYFGSLIDGFHRAGFSQTNLDRRNVYRHGWYMHLHGSPLFVGNRKLMRTERNFVVPNEQSHIVLTHVQHKPLVISSSSILSEYWSRLSKACNEVDEIIMFGYSGLDTHLNKIVEANCSGKQIRVIEWSGSGLFESRVKFWNQKFPSYEITLNLLENILDFTNWN